MSPPREEKNRIGVDDDGECCHRSVEEEQQQLEDDESTMEAPSSFQCPLTMEVMRDPVMTKYGHSYERDAILSWLVKNNGSCPMTRQPLKLGDIITNHQLRARIRRWQVDNQQDITMVCNSNEDFDGNVTGYFLLSGNDAKDMMAADETERSSSSSSDGDVVVEVTAVGSASGQQRRQRRLARFVGGGRSRSNNNNNSNDTTIPTRIHRRSPEEVRRLIGRFLRHGTLSSQSPSSTST